MRLILATVSLLAALVFSLSSARAGTYSWKTTDTSGNTTAQSPTFSGGYWYYGYGDPTLPIPYYWGDYGYGGSTNTGNSSGQVNSTGTITVVFTWQPDYPAEPAPPVLLAQTGDAYWFYDSSSPPAASCSDGLGDPEVTSFDGYTYRGESRGTHYSIASPDADGKITVVVTGAQAHVPQSGNLQSGYYSSNVWYEVNAYPITLNLGGTTPDSSGGDNILIGQECSASLTCNAPGVTFSDFYWTPQDPCFDSFQIASDQSTGQVYPVADSQWYSSNPHWHYSLDSGTGTFAVICSAEINIDGKPLEAVTVRKSVKVWVPYYYMNHNAGPTGIYGTGNNDVSTGGPNLTPPGMTFVGAVGTPALFVKNNMTGTWLFAQIVNSDHRQYYPTSPIPVKSGSQGIALDNGWPYKAEWPADSTANASTPQFTDDSPDLSLNNGVNQFNITDTYVMYMMYLPPGANSQYVPLHSLTWKWIAPNVTKPVFGNWPAGASGSVTVESDLRCDTHPSWSTKYTNQ